ncbi:MAG TPA: hypothetical protein VJA65_05900 [bacterium]|nr:hypothetical protein [bacterium]
MRVLRLIGLAAGVVLTIAVASAVGYIAYVVRLWSKAISSEEIPRLTA